MLQKNNIACSFHFVEENNINWLGVELLAVTNVLAKLGSKLSPAVFNCRNATRVFSIQVQCNVPPRRLKQSPVPLGWARVTESSY